MCVTCLNILKMGIQTGALKRLDRTLLSQAFSIWNDGWYPEYIKEKTISGRRNTHLRKFLTVPRVLQSSGRGKQEWAPSSVSAAQRSVIWWPECDLIPWRNSVPCPIPVHIQTPSPGRSPEVQDQEGDCLLGGDHLLRGILCCEAVIRNSPNPTMLLGLIKGWMLCLGGVEGFRKLGLPLSGTLVVPDWETIGSQGTCAGWGLGVSLITDIISSNVWSMSIIW